MSERSHPSARRSRPGRLFRIKRSPVHGVGAFACRRIRRGQHVAEYVGQRLTGDEVEARYDERAADDPHTFLFWLGGDAYVDASIGGGDARFINHSCAPNCEIDLTGDRISIRARKNIQPGVELTYDYALEIEDDAPPSRRALFACRCGAARCRGTMLDDTPGRGARAPRTRSRKTRRGHARRGRR